MLRITFAPETISMSASSWCGYSVRPCSAAQPANASKTASGSRSRGNRSAVERSSAGREHQIEDVAPGVEGALLELRVTAGAVGRGANPRSGSPAPASESVASIAVGVVARRRWRSAARRPGAAATRAAPRAPAGSAAACGAAPSATGRGRTTWIASRPAGSDLRRAAAPARRRSTTRTLVRPRCLDAWRAGWRPPACGSRPPDSRGPGSAAAIATVASPIPEPISRTHRGRRAANAYRSLSRSSASKCRPLSRPRRG